jgi:Zn-dependent protease with chaperone function
MVDALSEESIRKAFQGNIAPVRSRLIHRIAMLLVALLIITLPLIYVGLIVGACYLAYLHAIYDTWILGGGGLYVALARFAVYAAPLVAAAAIVFFMLKPFWARPPRRMKPLVLTQPEAPLLFEFVDLVRRAVRAPAPREIRLDVAVNASASFRRGTVSLLRPADLALTIGVPLLLGLTLRQLAGVLAHEFGHFSQGSAMRFSYLIRHVNTWLYRIAYERDEWDEQLAVQSKDTDWRIVLVLQVARLMVWLTRKIMAALAFVGNMVSAYSMRQAEYEADRYEARLAGSAEFEATSIRMAALLAGRQAAVVASCDAWRDGRLCTDLPGLGVALVDRAPAEAMGRIAQTVHDRKKGEIFDTHPPTALRIARARKEMSPGLVNLLGRAADLVPDLSAFACRATSAYYCDEEGINFFPQQILTLAAFMQRHGSRETEAEAAVRYFGACFGPLCPLDVKTTANEEPSNFEDSLQALDEARAATQRLQPLSATAASGPPTPEQLAPLRFLMQERLHAIVSLLKTPAVRTRVAQPDAMLDEVLRLLTLLLRLEAESAGLRNLMGLLGQAGQALENLARDPYNEHKIERFNQLMTMLRAWGDEFERHLQDIPYPFEHAIASLSVSAYLHKELPGAAGPTYQCERTGAILSRVHDLYARALGRVALDAEEVERVVADLSAGDSPGHDPHTESRAGSCSGDE